MPEIHPENNGTKSSPGKSSAARSGPPTSLDVARLAKVSRATVSYVLNDVPEARISEATRERVLQAAESLGYVPHEIASSLRSGRSDLVLLPFFDWPYNPSSIAYLQGLAQQLDLLGYTVMLRYFGQAGRASLVRKIAAFHPIGVIVGDEELTREDVEFLTRNGVKAVLAYGWSPTLTIPTIGFDFSIVGECVGQHFIKSGHRNIAAIVPRDPRILNLGLQRLAGLEKAGSQAGIQIERVDLDYDLEEAATLAARWCHGPRPSAVFTYNDDYGLLLMSALQNQELDIPKDIALVGCDDLPLCEMIRPRLSSVSIGSDTPSRAIVAYIDDMIQGRKSKSSPHIQRNCKLILRDSG
jgi:DNA-binding LacI/PurR family transcriptional regulator